MDALLQQLLTQTITLVPYTGQDAYGTPTYGTPVTVACRIEPVRLVKQTPTGEELTISSRIFLDGTVAISERDDVILPTGAHAAIQRLEPYPALDGSVDHVVVYI